MKTVFNIFEQISKTNSRNEKEDILKQNADNELLKKVLEYTYNPFKIYGIGEKSFKDADIAEVSDLNIIQLLDYLLENNTGTDYNKLVVNTFILSQPEEDRVWYKRIILKDLKIGITESTINKVFPALVPTFNYANQ